MKNRERGELVQTGMGSECCRATRGHPIPSRGWLGAADSLPRQPSKQSVNFFAGKKKSEELWVVPDYTPDFSVS